MKPKVFIGSSVEGLNVAYAIQQNLTRDAEPTVWDQGVFELSKTTIESLDKTISSVDFAILVLSPDDKTDMRGKSSSTVRDNVLFELGLFIGRLGRERVYFVMPDGVDMHISTDLVGVTPGYYDPNREDKSIQAATGAVCNQIRNQILDLGTLVTEQNESPSDKSTEESTNSKDEWLIDFLNKDYTSAKNKLEEVIRNKEEEERSSDTAWFKYIQLKLGEKDSLKNICDYAKENEDDLDIQYLIPRFLLWEDYHDKAIELIEFSLDKNPSNNDLVALQAKGYLKKGDTDKAVAILENASPCENPSIAIDLTEIYEEIEDIDSALKVIGGAYKVQPSNKSIMYKYSRLLSEVGRHKEAVFLLNKLTLNHPESVTYWGYLSNSCLKLDLCDKAMAACKKAKELSEGKAAWILHNIGNMLNNKGFYSEAIDSLNKGLSIDKNSEYAHDRLSTALKSKAEEQKKFISICKEGRQLIRIVPIKETEDA